MPAIVGVDARTSAARSQSGVSCSCPTAETTGTGHAATARTSRSSLNGSRSSKLPPPRASTITSTPGCAQSARSASTIALRRPRALDVRLGDEHVRRGEARLDRRDDVALRGGVVAGDEPDPARQERQRALPLGGEEALGRELRLQPLERDEVRADAEALDRERAQAEVAALLEELGPAEDVHALAVGEVEPQRRRTGRAASSRRRTSRRRDP